MRAVMPSLLSDFPRGDPDRTADQFTPPDAAFAPPGGIKSTPALAWRAGMIFLGVVDGEVKTDADGRRYVTGGHAVGLDDDRHICTFAGSRSGKGRAAIIPNMLHYPGSVLATDPKGELATMTARRRAAMGQAVHVLDPFGVAGGAAIAFRAGFNPIEAMRLDDNLVADAALIADALVVGAGKDPHWDESAKAFIEGVILHLRTWTDYEGRRNLLTLRELVGQGAADGNKDKAPSGYSLDALAAEMRINESAGGVIQTAAADFFDRPQNERGSVLSTARRHLKFIDLFRNDLGRKTLETHGFDLAALKTKPTTIYLCLPARHIGTCNRWLRLFVNLMLQSMEQTRGKLPGGVPVLVVLDEFATLGHMQQIEDAAGQIAGFGVKLWPILQDLSQLKALYDTRWETFLGNAGILQFFGNNDLSTLEWINKRCGKSSIRATRKSDVTVSAGMAGSTGESTGTEVHDLLTMDEAARYFGRDDPMLRQLVIWAGRRTPFLVLQRAYYDKHGLFAGLFDAPAP
jgi:type IV secretion system protein VirD4